ncbi:Uncharacterized protein BM_BM10878 [Brugia malayi]|uniref:Bm10878 n=1 Tax=Brugia malayi TaxID=6279 RepID=A0A0H5SCC2_BRUMA|nr:Uncharacterized protein BM_BM10878 [Brugia malayi]CRZ25736.1 Bm10878 [Brugia malayi]VIO90981.1 Uncharacterized protein BM_BM10878 [Brugia malayi]
MQFLSSLYDVMENKRDQTREAGPCCCGTWMQSSDDNSDESWCRWDGGRAESVSSHISRPLSHPLVAMTVTKERGKILKLLMSRAVEEIGQLGALYFGIQQLLSSEMQQPPNSAQHCENPPFCCLLFSF